MPASTNQSEFVSAVDYDRILSELPSRDLEFVILHLSAELPYVWRIFTMNAVLIQQNIMRTVSDGLTNLFDFSSELVNQGTLAPNLAVEDRIVAVHGRSQPSEEEAH